jgi:hypothetical protein
VCYIRKQDKGEAIESERWPTVLRMAVWPSDTACTRVHISHQTVLGPYDMDNDNNHPDNPGVGYSTSHKPTSTQKNFQHSFHIRTASRGLGSSSDEGVHAAWNDPAISDLLPLSSITPLTQCQWSLQDPPNAIYPAFDPREPVFLSPGFSPSQMSSQHLHLWDCSTSNIPAPRRCKATRSTRRTWGLENP